MLVEQGPSISVLPIDILIIDDHDIVRAGIELLLRQRLASVNVHSFSGLGEAFDSCAATPAIIVLDLNLKGLSGQAALPLVRLRWAEARIIILTAEQDQAILASIERAGIAALIRKSDSAEQLLKVVGAITAGLAAGSSGGARAIEPLSRRQIEVLQHLRHGLTNKAIARILNLSEYTVRGHVQQIIKATGATNRSHAVFIAIQAGIL